MIDCGAVREAASCSGMMETPSPVLCGARWSPTNAYRSWREGRRCDGPLECSLALGMAAAESNKPRAPSLGSVRTIQWKNSWLQAEQNSQMQQIQDFRLGGSGEHIGADDPRHALQENGGWWYIDGGDILCLPILVLSSSTGVRHSQRQNWVRAKPTDNGSHLLPAKSGCSPARVMMFACWPLYTPRKSRRHPRHV